MNCTKYDKISNNLENLRKLIDKKIDCDNKNGAKNVTLKNSEIVNVDSTIKVLIANDPKYNGNINPIRPLLIDTKTSHRYSETEKLLNSIKSDVVEDCNLCKNYFFNGFKTNNEKFTNSIVLGQKIAPGENEMFLLFKNFVITNNLAPYFPEHLMILSQNHKPYSIPGSQYEILNLETISDINSILVRLRKDFFAGSNYANTGSQHHFHIHLIKKQPRSNYGFSRYIDILINNIENLNDFEEVESNLFYKKVDNLNDANSESKIETIIQIFGIDKEINLTKFEEKNFGYKGILLSIKSNDLYNNLKEFNIIQRNILNYIENSTTHTFTLLYPDTNKTDTFSLVIFCQELTRKTAFRQFMGLIDIYHYSFTVNFLKNNIYDYYIRQDDLFTKKKLLELIQPVIYSDYNPYSDNQIRSLFKSEEIQRSFETVKLNKFFKKQIKNKKINSNPKLIIINSPMAAGKSLLVKNLNSIIKNYKEEDFVHINLDDILESNDQYNNELKIISNFLKNNYYYKKIKSFNIPNLNSETYNFKISDLRNNTYLELLTHTQVKSIIDFISNIKVKKQQNKLVEDSTGEPIEGYFQKLFYKFENSNSRVYLLKSICNFCYKNKLNVLIEIAARNYSSLIELFLDPSQYQDEFYQVYRKNNIYYVSYDFNQNDNNIKRFIYRNGLIRNILEGRVISSDKFLRSLTDYKQYVQKTYTHIPNIFLKNLNNKIPVDFNLDSKFLDFYKYNDFNEIDLECVSNYGEYEDVFELKTKTFPDGQEMSIGCFNKVDLELGQEFPNQKFKGICNDFILENLMFDSNITFLIKVLFDESKKIIANVTSKYENITEDDIKLVFKGGMNIRFYILEFQKVIINKLNLNNNNIIYKTLKKLFKRINKNSFDDEFKVKDNLFSTIAKKSDLDFVLLINKNKFSSKDEYDFVKSELISYFNMLLHRFGIYMNKTNFMYTDTIIDKKEFCKKRGINKIEKINKRSYIVADEYNINIQNKDKKSFIVYPKFIDENNIHKNELTSYYSYYMPNFTLPNRIEDKDKILSDKIDILRLKGKFNLNFFENQFEKEEEVVDKGELKNIESDGEVIDIVFESYNKESDFDKIQKIKFNDTLNDFEFNIFNLEYLIKDLFRMLSGRLFPWADRKYDKRLYRLIYLMIIRLIIEDKPNELDIQNSITEAEIRPDNILYQLKEMVINTNNRVNMISEYNLPQLQEFLSKLSIKSDNIILEEFKRNMRLENEKFNKSVNAIIKECKNIYDNIVKILNKEIKSELGIKLKNLPVVTMWGGANYNLLKKQYLEMKGGGLVFNDSGRNIDGMSDRYRTTSDYEYVKFFFTNDIKKLKVDNINFNDSDIQNTRFLGCGSFGCGILVPHSGTGKKFIFKVVNDDNTYDYSNRTSEIRETYYGYYLTLNKKPNANSFYAYFNANRRKYGQPGNSKPYFSSIVDEIKYDGNNTVIPMEATNSNIFIIMIEGGTDNIQSLTQYLNTKYNLIASNNDTKKKCLDILSSLLVQTLNVYKLSTCHHIANKCVYFTHNDIKPENSIFIDRGNDNFEFQYIDFGGGAFSTDFFSNKEVFAATPAMKYLVTREYNYVSPIIDLGMAIHSIVLGCVSNKTNSWFKLLNGGYKSKIDDLKTKLYQNNLVEYTVELKNMHKFLKDSIKNYLFNNDITSINYEVNHFINKLLVLVNLAVHITNWLKTNNAEVKKVDNKGVFKNFKINLIKIKNKKYTLKEFSFSKDSINYELLEKIVIATSIQLNTM